MLHTQVHYIGGTIAIAASCSAIKQNAECLMITNDNMAAFCSGITQNCHCSLLLHLAKCLNLAAQQKLAALQNHVALQNLPAGTNLAAGPNLGAEDHDPLGADGLLGRGNPRASPHL